MKKLVGSFLLVLVLLLSFSDSNLVSAQNEDSKTSTPASEINSFELFWPISAGKTVGDSLFFVKNLKENLRGLIIFGMPQKADYAVFLATKRVVEAEKLINDGKVDLANETLEMALVRLEKGIAYTEKALTAGTPFSDQAISIKNRLTNLEAFLPWLALRSGKNKETLNAVWERVQVLNQKI